MQHYRRNSSDRTLRALEREYALAEDATLLRKIDKERRRLGFFSPHPATRHEVASERLDEYNYQCFMVLHRLVRNNVLDHLANHEDVIDWHITETRLPERIRELVTLRELAMDDVLGASIGQPMRKEWANYLATHNYTIPEYGELPAGAMEGKSVMPHLQRAGAEERWQQSDSIRRSFDAQSYDLLNELVRLGILNTASLEAYYEDTEEAEEIVISTSETLLFRELCHEEVYRSQLNLEPNERYQHLIGQRYWWKHIDK